MANDFHNAAHLSSINAEIPRPMNVFLPTVYRHIPQEYVDRFFATGELRLSSFSQFRKHKNEFQGDDGEGLTMLGIIDKETDRSFITMNTVGHNDFVLSTTVRSTGAMNAAFGDASIEIFDPIEFVTEVASEIPGCVAMCMGWCVYAENRLLISDQRGPSIEEFKDDDDPSKISLEKMHARAELMSGPKQLFLKPIKHEVEAEFRFIWRTKRPVDEPIIIKFHQPERFCRPGKARA